MLSYSENGFEDIISTRSKIIKEENKTIFTSTLKNSIDNNTMITNSPLTNTNNDMTTKLYPDDTMNQKPVDNEYNANTITVESTSEDKHNNDNMISN